jgi:hypothetical protein
MYERRDTCDCTSLITVDDPLTRSPLDHAKVGAVYPCALVYRHNNYHFSPIGETFQHNNGNGLVHCIVAHA